MKQISYPNNIQDHHTVVKIREMIDHANSLKRVVDSTVEQANTNAKAISTLPKSFVTPGDVNAQINNWGTASLKHPPPTAPSFIEVLNAGLLQLGFTVPQPPATTRLGVGPPPPESEFEHEPVPTPATSATESHDFKPIVTLGWGPRADAPPLERKDAGFLYYVTDYAHLALWDGWAWHLTDGGGGYLVDSTVDLETGYQICDGSETDYILQDTPDLAVARITTERYHPLWSSHKRYFRR